MLQRSASHPAVHFAFLLLYDAPPQLYVRTGQTFVTPLVFPTHLSRLIEKDVSQLSTLSESERVLAQAYVGRHCRLIKVVPTLERQRTDMIAVWGDCRR